MENRKNDEGKEAEETVEAEENKIVAELAKSGTLQEHEDDENMRHSVKLLGEGGNGHAILWQKVDGNRNVTDVSKVLYPGSSNMSTNT